MVFNLGGIFGNGDGIGSGPTPTVSKFLQGFQGPGGFLTGTTRDTGQTITRQSVSPQVSNSPSFQSALSIFDNILKGGELPETFRQSVTSTNLIGLGEASNNLSTAINEQITIRENQRATDNEAAQNRQIAQTSINEGFTTSLGDLTKSLGDIGKGGFDPIKFLTDNPIIGGIGIGGLLVGGVVLLVVLKS